MSKQQNSTKSNKAKVVASTIAICGIIAGSTYFLENHVDAFNSVEQKMELTPPLQFSASKSFDKVIAMAYTQDEYRLIADDITQRMKENNALTFVSESNIAHDDMLKQKLIKNKTEYEAELKKAEQIRKEQEEAARQKALEEAKEKEANKKVENVKAVQNEGYIPSAHYNYLVKKVNEYGLDLKKTLAVMKHESNFNPNAISSTNDYGYFQINIVNHNNLSALLGTANEPLNPYVNIDWGTYMLADLTNKWTSAGLSGSALDDAVLSSYNKGLNGYKKYGKATVYLEKWRAAYNQL